MTIDEAIKENEATITNKSSYLLPGEIVAIQLGIEALKNKQDIRHSIYPSITELLPGETKGGQ